MKTKEELEKEYDEMLEKHDEFTIFLMWGDKEEYVEKMTKYDRDEDKGEWFTLQRGEDKI